MAARYCRFCDIKYPASLHGDQRCMVPHCAKYTSFTPLDDPDEDWRERLAEAARNPKEPSEPEHEIERFGVHPAAANAQVYDVDGLQFIAHHELIDEGYLNLEDFGIVLVNGRWYELQGHTRRTYLLLGERMPAGAWWVEEIVLDEETSEDSS